MSVALFQKNNVITESACGNRFLFQGREYDYDTALYYFRNRWYEPETGRWLSPDPIGISGGLNLYAFCGNDPVNFVDPEGKDFSTWTGLGSSIGGDFRDHSGKPSNADLIAQEFLTGAAIGTAAIIDGILPKINPFSDYFGVYSPWDTEYRSSRKAGEIVRATIIQGVLHIIPFGDFVSPIAQTINIIVSDDDFFKGQ